MPKTAMHEYRFPSADERDIRSSREVFAMEPIAVSHSMETPPDCHFRLRIRALNGLHDAPSLFVCPCVHNEHD